MKSSSLKRLLRITITAVCLYATARFCHHQTKGFSLSKIRNNTSCIEGQVSEPMPKELLSQCNQPFHFIGKGTQSYVFVSEDETLVLKLFKNCKEGQKAQDFQSYQIAIHALSKETGLLFFHPKICQECPTVTITDPLGSPHQIDLSQYAFLLQKKADDPFSFLKECEEKKDVQRAKEALTSLSTLLKKTRDLGIWNRDVHKPKNIGFLEGKAIFVDVGSLRKIEEEAEDPEEIAWEMNSLRPFMEEQTPTLMPVLNEIVHNLEQKPRH